MPDNHIYYPHFEPHFPRDQWTVPKVLEFQALNRPDRPCLSWTDSGSPLSFSDVNALANRVGRGFQSLGLSKGDFVCIFLPNCLEYILTWYGLSKIGGVEVTVGDNYKGDILRHQISLSKPRVIVTTPELSHLLAEIEDELPHLEYCVLVGGSASGAARFSGIKAVEFEDIYREISDASNLDIPVTPRDTAAVLFTSGTTGLSKGVLMSHSQFYFFAEEDAQLTNLKDDDVYSTGFPLFHGNAQFLTVYPCLIAGAHCVLYPRFSASDFFGRIRRSGTTVCNLLGATMSFILSQPPSPDDRDHKLTRIYAAPLAPDLAVRFTERFGVEAFVDGFGQTEISNVFMTPPGEPRPPGASGCLVNQFFDVRLIDPETDEDVPEGESGELVVRNKVPYIMCDGYLGMPEKTVETWKNLWFHTGDVMRRDEKGWYYFVDRVKDALRRRGENISSFEVESVIRSYPGVDECAVVAAPADEAGGEDEVKAFIVPSDGRGIDFADLIAWCDKKMPSFMVPRFLETISEMPKTPSEKIQKKKLREQGNGPDTWDRLEQGCRLGHEKSQV